MPKTYSAKSAAIRAASKQLGGIAAFIAEKRYPETADGRWTVEIELLSGAGPEIEQAVVARGFALAAPQEKSATVEPDNACEGAAPHASNEAPNDEGREALEPTHTEENAMQDENVTENTAAEATEAEAAPEKPAKEPRIVQNDVMLPKPGSKCGIAWAIFDEVSVQKEAPATIAEAVELAEKQNAEGADINLGNLRAEYGRWRKFHGVPAQGRAKKAAPAEAAPEGEAAPEEQATEE